MRPSRFAAATTFLLAALLCPVSASANHSDTEISASLSELAGVWRSEGYGQVLRIITGDPMAFERYEVSGISCLLVNSGALHHLENAYARVLRNADSSRFTHIWPGNVTTYAYDRLDELPAQCRNGGTGFNSDPLFNFDVFWLTFNEMYAFFERRGVDWSALRDQHRPRLVAENTDETLFEVMADMATALCDGHVQLSNGSEEFNAGVNPTCLEGNDLFLEIMEEFENQQVYQDPFEYFQLAFRPAVLQNIEDRYLVGGLSAAANGKIHWGDLGGGVGYLGVRQMTDLANDEATEQQDLDVLGPVLDQVMAEFASMDFLVLDIRLNTGGYDHVALALADRFADRPRIAFSKKARSGIGFTDKQVSVLTPPASAGFSRPIVILTSGLSASAAENFLLAVRDLPHATIVGETTVGVHSDVLVRRLPNNWTFSLSNEVYEAADGTVFEGLGIAPDVEIAALRAADRAVGRDAGIEAALQLAAFPHVFPGLTGTWWNPTRMGEGYTFDFFVLGGTRYLFVTFYTYDAEGNQAYLVGVTTDLANPVTFNLGITEGGTFGPAYDPASQVETPWGTLSVDFRSCTEATVTLESSTDGFEGYSTDIQRLGENPYGGGNCS